MADGNRGTGAMEPLRYVVGTLDCDALGHLNVARYFALSNKAGFAMQTSIGWAPGQTNAGRRYSFAVVHADSDFLAEVHEGEVLLVRPGIRSIGTKSAVFDTLISRENGEAVFRSAWKSALLDLDSRRAVEIPDDLRAALQALLVDQ